MFRSLRAVHRWIGIVNSLFLMLMAGTGILLAVKKRFDWIQPPAQKGEDLASLREVAPLGQIADAVFAVRIPEMKERADIDRFELHVDKNLFKVTSKTGHHEVQVDAKTGKVLSVAKRNDMLIEQIHDMSFFSPAMHDWILPGVAICLFLLGLTGIYMFWVPIGRRWKFRREQRKARE